MFKRYSTYAGLALVAAATLLSTGSTTPDLPVATPDASPATSRAVAQDSVHAELEGRLARLSRAFDATEQFYEVEVQPIEKALHRYSRDTVLVKRIAVSLVREGALNRLSPRLLTGVLLVENPWLDPEIKSFVGATGLMQVMPFHAGQWGCASSDLTDVSVNICHGARILRFNLNRAGGDMTRALLGYNGCVYGTNTPDCHRYPQWVRSRAPGAPSHAKLIAMAW